MKQTLTIFTLAYNLNKIKYPWRASIASALHYANEVIVMECFSTDGTYEELEQLASTTPKLKIIRHPWGTTSWIQKTLAEIACKEAKSDWIFYLNADEVIHHDSIFNFALLKRMGFKFGRTHYTHFLGNFHTTWPFIYDTVTRTMNGNIAEWSNDAAQIDCDHTKAMEMPVDIYHYGKVSVGREIEAGIKEQEFQQLYVEFGFPDKPLMKIIEERGCLDYADMFRNRWKENGEPDQSKPFTGTHPVFVLDWIKQQEEAQKAYLLAKMQG